MSPYLLPLASPSLTFPLAADATGPGPHFENHCCPVGYVCPADYFCLKSSHISNLSHISNHHMYALNFHMNYISIKLEKLPF